MLHAPFDGQLIDRFLHRAVNQVQPDIGLLLLANAINSGNGLKLESGIEQWFAQKDVVSIDEIQTG